MKLGIIGLGHVGLVAAACFAELGHEVFATDNDTAKLNSLLSGAIPIHEHGLFDLVAKHQGKTLHLWASLREIASQAEVIFLCVGTPATSSGAIDLSSLDAAVDGLARCVRRLLLIVEKSTVPVRTCESVQRIMYRAGAPPNSVYVASNPEFLREGTAVSDFLFPRRIVIGADERSSLHLLREIYRPLTSGAYYRQPGRVAGETSSPVRLIETSTKSAELIKYAANAFLAMKISFVNAVANIAEASGADIAEVVEGIGSDSRIGTEFLRPGIGYGGSCFPKDVRGFDCFAKSLGVPFDLLTATTNINLQQRMRFVEKIRTAVSGLKGKRIAALGLAYKGGTDDIRESPAIDIIRQLVREGAHVTAFDPAAMQRARHELPRGLLRFAGDPYAAMRKADALIILSDWPEFARLDLTRVRTLLLSPIVIDGRNLYSPAQMHQTGLSYLSIGRPPYFADVETVLPDVVALEPGPCVQAFRAEENFNPAV